MARILEVDGVATLIGGKAINEFYKKGNCVVKKEKCVFCGHAVGYSVDGESRDGTCSWVVRAAQCPLLHDVSCGCKGRSYNHVYGMHTIAERTAILMGDTSNK